MLIFSGKLLSRAQKIAYALSQKVFSKGPEQITLKPGDRVALVYPNSDPLKWVEPFFDAMLENETEVIFLIAVKLH